MGKEETPLDIEEMKDLEQESLDLDESINPPITMPLETASVVESEEEISPKKRTQITWQNKIKQKTTSFQSKHENFLL